MPNRDLKEVRREYETAQMNREEIHIDPFVQFSEWLDYAQNTDVIDPTSMILSTCDKNLQPHSRVVLLKETSEKGFVFYTDYNSSKARELSYNPKASLLFYWPQLDRQVRIEGTIEKVSREKSISYFDSRPLDSQIAAISSQQSQYVPGRKTLEMNFNIAESEYDHSRSNCPESWGGYQLKPETFEFWQGRENRLHDRFIFQLQVEQPYRWQISRVAP